MKAIFKYPPKFCTRKKDFENIVLENGPIFTFSYALIGVCVPYFLKETNDKY